MGHTWKVEQHVGHPHNEIWAGSQRIASIRDHLLGLDSADIAHLVAAVPEYHENHQYLDSIIPDLTGLDNGEPIEITITVKAARDIRAALAKATG